MSAISPIIGLSWLGVEQTSTEPSSFTQSHAQPEPKRVAAAAAKAVLNASNEPNLASIAAARSPLGAEAPPGVMTFQKREWLRCPPPLLRTAASLSAGTLSRFCTS